MVWLLLILVLTLAAWGIAYSRSAASRARQQANTSLATFVDLDRKLQQQEEFVGSNLGRVAGSYIQEVRLDRLRSIPIDELKRHAPGARLQALKDNGIRNLADIRGWSFNRLTQVRGVGPKSAGLIAHAANALAAKSDAQPIPHPDLTSAGKRDRELLAAAFLLRWSQPNIPEKRQALKPVITEFQTSKQQVFAWANLWHWVAGFDGNRQVQLGIAEANAAAARLVGDGPVAQLRKDIVRLLGQADEFRGHGVAWDQVVKDYAANGGAYAVLMASCLGPVGGSTNVRSPSAAQEPVTVRAASTPAHVRIPTPPPSFTASPLRSQAVSEFWVNPGRAVTVKGYPISGGMVYVGTGLMSVNGGDCEPSLIDPNKPVAGSGVDCHVRYTNYWPSYGSISPEARASHLQWLSLGKSDPAADIGYVFLYFYGLERRVLADVLHDTVAKAELPIIEEEIRRLLGIYGNNASFRAYAGSLLDYLVAGQGPPSSLAGVPPQLPFPSRSLDTKMRVVLGLFAQSGKPLPVEWAAAWYARDPNTPQFHAMKRCPDAFAALFNIEYTRRFGDGFILPVNKTRIKVTHRPASQSFAGKEFQATIDLPDVSVLTGPMGKLAEVGEACHAALASYSRFLSSHPGKEGSLEALLLLPASVWPDSIAERFRVTLRAIESSGLPMIVSLEEFLPQLPHDGPLNRTRFKALSRALGQFSLGIEPDVRFGGDLPEPEDLVCLFAADGLDDEVQLSEGYASGAIMVQMAAAVASASKSFDEAEASVILNHINSSLQIAEAERRRLAARLHLYGAAPPRTSHLKRQIGILTPDARQAVADFLLTVALADGAVDPRRVKTLEHLYQIMGLDRCSLYSKIHDLESQPVSQPASTPTQTARQAPSPFNDGSLRLDPARIAALRADSAKVALLLGKVFASVEENEREDLPKEPAPEGSAVTLLGLDSQHSALLKVLLQRTEWSREEIEELCSDRGLMSDGAIERINDAAFNQFDKAIIEGEDPLEVNCELLQEAMA